MILVKPHFNDRHIMQSPGAEIKFPGKAQTAKSKEINISEKTLNFFFFFKREASLEGFSHSLPNTAELPGQNREVTNSQGETPRPRGSQFSAGHIDKSQAQLKASIPQPRLLSLP